MSKHIIVLLLITFLALVSRADEISSTDTDESPSLNERPSKEALKLAKQITKWKRITDQNIWFECGIKYTKDQIYPAALEWAQALTKAQKNTTYKLRRKDRKIEMREVLGLIITESRFDRCAVGPNPRKFAYKLKLLQRSSNNISHSLEDLEKVFTHPRFKRRLADVGPGQIVIKTSKMSWEEIKKYLSLDPGVQIVFDLLAKKGRNYRTLMPSTRWPGTANHLWYYNKAAHNGSTILKIKVK